MADSIQALRDLVTGLSRLDGVHAHLCDGDRRTAVAWSEQSEITARIHAAADDEMWVLAGSGLLARAVADSEGSFELEPLILAILTGRAIELFGPAEDHEQLAPLGWRVPLEGGGTFAADVDEALPAVAASIAGPWVRARLA